MTGAERKGRLIRALFEELRDAPDGMSAKDAIEAVRSRITLAPEEEGAFEQSGVEKLPSIVRFSTITVTKAGWMTKNAGTWAVTDEGLKALADYSSPAEFWKHAKAGYAAWKKTRIDAGDDEDTEDEVAQAISVEEAEDQARLEVLDYISTMPPLDFQEACAKLVDALGHRVVWIAPAGPDGGVDFLAYADPIGATGRRIKGQAKRQQAKQDVDALGAFLSKLKSEDTGLFIALGGFTKNAVQVARDHERRVVLLDGPEFVRLWIENYASIDEEGRRLLPLKPIWRLDRQIG